MQLAAMWQHVCHQWRQWRNVMAMALAGINMRQCRGGNVANNRQYGGISSSVAAIAA